jgi:hypothetical protein
MIWRPVYDDGRTPAIAYLADNRRRREAEAMAFAAMLISAASVLSLPSAWFLAVIAEAAVLLLAAHARYRTIRTGYYQLTAAGQPGAFLGHVPPNLALYQRA